MLTKAFLASVAFSSAVSFAAQSPASNLSGASDVSAEPAMTDLELEGARWLGAANGYVCKGKVTVPVAAPSELTAIGVAFESVATDFSLDNGLLKATFVESGETCRYSAYILANNALKTVTLVDSRAYTSTVGGTSDCAVGKALLDKTLAANTYNFQERPHHLTVLVDSVDAPAVCGAGATTIGIDFTLVGKIQ